MVTDNRATIDQALQLLGEGLAAFLARRLREAPLSSRVEPSLARDLDSPPGSSQDPAVSLRIMRTYWNDLCGNLDRRVRTYVHEATDIRNAWAHHAIFSDEDVGRALDTISRLLRAVEAPQADRASELLEVSRNRSGTGTLDRSVTPAAKEASSVWRATAANRPRRDLPNTAAFREELRKRLEEATREGREFLEVNSGDLHRDLGGGYGRDGRIAPCCDVMHEAAGPHDEVLECPPKGRGTRLTIRYRLPR